MKRADSQTDHDNVSHQGNWLDGTTAVHLLQRRTLSDQATELLREAIVTGRLLPGQRLTQVQLAIELGISRTPLREALRKLEIEGLVLQVDAQRLEVIQLSQRDLLDLNALREMVDGLSARTVAEQHGHALPAEFLDLIGRMEHVATQGDLQAWRALDIEFHEAIVRLAGNRYVLRLLPTIRLSSTVYQRVLWRTPNHPHAALEEHKRILESILSLDPDFAEQAAREHVRNRQAAFLRSMTDDSEPGSGSNAAERRT